MFIYCRVSELIVMTHHGSLADLSPDLPSCRAPLPLVPKGIPRAVVAPRHRNSSSQPPGTAVKSLALRENSRKPRVFTSMFLAVPVETHVFFSQHFEGCPKSWLNFIIQVSEPILCWNGKLMFILVCGLTQSHLKTKLTDCKDCAFIWRQIVW